MSVGFSSVAIHPYASCWVFAAHGLSPAVVSVGYSLVVVKYWLLIDMSSLVENKALGVQASVVVVHGLTCPPACGIFLDQGFNPCPLHWQAES